MFSLLDDAFAPITDKVGFVEADVDQVREWLMQRSASHLAGAQSGFADLRSALSALQPLTTSSSKFLVIPSTSGWVAYFDNTRTGTDGEGVVASLASVFACRGIWAAAVPNTFDGVRGRLGATIFALYGPEPKEWLNLVRGVYLINEGDRWSFDIVGNPLPFEDAEVYAAAIPSERFTPQMLEHYLSELGIDAASERFYVPEGAHLIAEEPPAGSGAISLKEIQAEL